MVDETQNAENLQNPASKYRVAVASTDGETVNTHYGKANLFYIYYVDDEEGYDFVETRAVTPVCMDGSHLKSQMDKSVLQFTDCKYLIVSRLGSAAVQALSSAGITAMELPGSIEEAILKVWKFNRIQGLFER